MVKKGRILICDDEAGVREAMTLILGKEYHLLYATNGQEALETVRKQDPDMVIMDIKMPRLGGLETLPKMKQVKPSLKILIVSGYDSSDVAAQAIHLGADNYLTKPFARDDIRTQVRTLLGSS